MRLLLVLALTLGAAGAAQAQIQPIAPIAKIAPITQPKAIEPKPTPGFEPFRPYEPPKPYTPPKHYDPNTTPSGLYPEMYRKPKKTNGGF